MLHAPIRPFATRRFRAWWLWLALLLPVAQGAAVCHAVSHSRADQDAVADDPRVAHLQACDLCLTLAGVGAAAPLGEAARVPPACVRHGLPRAHVCTGVVCELGLAYRSRAPPIDLV